MQSRAITLVAGILSAAAAPARAQAPTDAGAAPSSTTDADLLASQAEELAGAGDYMGAAAKFLAAYAIDSRAESLCNVGVAYQRARIWARAHAFLSDCIAKGRSLDADFIALVKQALTEVEATLRASDFAPVDVVVAPSDAQLTFSTFGANEKLRGSRTVWMPVGAHSVVAEARGYETTQRELVVAPRKPQRIPIALAKIVVEQRRIEKAADRSMVTAIFATSVTVAVGAAAVVTYVKARKAADNADAVDITRDEYDDFIADARQWKHISWGLAGAAVVGAGVSGYLWYRYASTPMTLEVSPAANGATVTFATHW